MPFAARTVVVTRGAIAAGLAMGGFVHLLAYRNYPPLALRDWLITYEHGWVQRGLLGTIARQVTGDEVTVEFIATVGTTVAVLLVVMFSLAVAWMSVNNQGISWPHLLLGVGATMSPVGFPTIAANLARVDHVMMLLAGVAVLVARRRPDAAGGLLAGAVLVHPSALLLIVPWVAALRRDDIRAVWMIAAPPVALFAWQAFLAPSVPQRAMEASMQSGTDFQVWDGAAWTMYMSAVDHVLWSARWALTGGGRGPLMVAATLLAVVPLAVAVRLVLRWSETQLPRSLAIGAGAPLLLCLVAIDYGRWVTFAGVATVASVMTVVPRDPTAPPWRVIIACAAVPLVGVITGPLILRGFGRMIPMM